MDIEEFFVIICASILRELLEYKWDIMQKQELKSLEAKIRKRTEETASKISRLLVFGMIFELLALALDLANMWKYSMNNQFIYISAFVALLLIIIFLYTIRVYRNFKRIGARSKRLSLMLEEYLGFYRRFFNPWIGLYSLSVILLIYAFNMRAIDFSTVLNFRFFVPFLMIYIGAFVLLFIVTRITFGRYLKMFRIFLSDLEMRQLSDEETLEGSFGRFKLIIMGVLGFLLAVLIVIYIIKFHPFNT